jgi:hypothetical protein
VYGASFQNVWSAVEVEATQQGVTFTLKEVISILADFKNSGKYIIAG